MRGRAAAPSPPPWWSPGTRLCQTLVDSRESQAGPPAPPCAPQASGAGTHPRGARGGLGRGSLQPRHRLGCASHLWALCNHPLAWRGRNGLFLNQNTFFYYYCYGFYFFSLSELPGVCIYKYLYI